MIIFVCSPARGETTARYNRNMKNAAQYSRSIALQGDIPITPHLFFRDFLEERKPDERARGMKMGKELLRFCDEVWVYGADGISEGMKDEIELAEKLGKTVRYK